MHKYTDEQIKFALSECVSNTDDCDICPFDKEEHCIKVMKRCVLDLINRQEAEIEELKEKSIEDNKLLDVRVSESVKKVSEANQKYVDVLEKTFNDRTAELKTAKAEIERLEKRNEMLSNTRDSILITHARELCRAKSEAIKEFWNQRPPMLNPNFNGKEQYNKGWNDCISFFAEEYKILLGIEKRNENECPDTAEEMVGESK